MIYPICFEMSNYKVIIFETESGKAPVKDFLLSLDPKMRAKMARTINLLEANGMELREPFSKYIGDDIFELRAKVGTDISRVLYFFFVGKTIVLTNGFIKKTRRAPRREIKLAKKYRKTYIERKEKQNGV